MASIGAPRNGRGTQGPEFLDLASLARYVERQSSPLASAYFLHLLLFRADACLCHFHIELVVAPHFVDQGRDQPAQDEDADDKEAECVKVQAVDQVPEAATEVELRRDDVQR